MPPTAVARTAPPFAYGSVAIAGDDGIPRTAALEANGRYTIADLPCGAARVSVHSPDPAEQEKLFEAEQIKWQKGIKPPVERTVPAIDRDRWIPIPEHYGDFFSSGLKLNVERGLNTFDIQLK